jgi:predicted ATP-grasp superfamily ATP-dependent carboligase
MTTPSRGYDIRNYTPMFDGGAVIPLALISAGFTTGVTAGGILSAHLGAASVTSAKIGTAAVTYIKMKAAFLSGTISGLLSGVVAVAHGLGVKPKSVVVSTLATHADVVAGRYVLGSAASAATTTNIYLKATKSGNVKYAAYVQI